MQNKHRLTALLLTFLIHLIIVGMLLLLTLRAASSAKKDIPQLLLVQAGNVDMSSGEVKPQGSPQSNEVPQPAPATSSPPSTTKPTVQPKPQKNRENLTAQDKPQPMDAAQAENIKRQEEARRQAAKAEKLRREQEEEKVRQEQIRQEINSKIAGAFNGKSTNQNQGTGSKPAGNQGVPGGSGNSYSLEGRTIVTNGGILTRPRVTQEIRGRIRVRITVNNQGHVTEAWIEPQGTQISDSGMRNAALSAAKATRFNAIPGGNDQRGIITYHFEIQ